MKLKSKTVILNLIVVSFLMANGLHGKQALPSHQPRMKVIDLNSLTIPYSKEEKYKCSQVLSTLQSDPIDCSNKSVSPISDLSLVKNLSQGVDKCHDIKKLLNYRDLRTGATLTTNSTSMGCLEKELCHCTLPPMTSQTELSLQKDLEEATDIMLQEEDRLVDKFIDDVVTRGKRQTSVFLKFLESTQNVQDYLPKEDVEEYVDSVETVRNCSSKESLSLPEGCPEGFKKRVEAKLLARFKQDSLVKIRNGFKDKMAEQERNIEKILKVKSSKDLIEMANLSLRAAFKDYLQEAYKDPKANVESLARECVQNLKNQSSLCKKLRRVGQIYSVHPLLGYGDQNIERSSADALGFLKDLEGKYDDLDKIDAVFRSYVAKKLDTMATVCNNANFITNKMCNQSDEKTGKLRIQFDLFSFPLLQGDEDKAIKLYCYMQKKQSPTSVNLPPSFGNKMDEINHIFKVVKTNNLLSDDIMSGLDLTLFDKEKLTKFRETVVQDFRQPLIALAHCLHPSTQKNDDCRLPVAKEKLPEATVSDDDLKILDTLKKEDVEKNYNEVSTKFAIAHKEYIKASALANQSNNSGSSSLAPKVEDEDLQSNRNQHKYAYDSKESFAEEKRIQNTNTNTMRTDIAVAARKETSTPPNSTDSEIANQMKMYEQKMRELNKRLAEQETMLKKQERDQLVQKNNKKNSEDLDLKKSIEDLKASIDAIKKERDQLKKENRMISAKKKAEARSMLDESTNELTHHEREVAPSVNPTEPINNAKGSIGSSDAIVSNMGADRGEGGSWAGSNSSMNKANQFSPYIGHTSALLLMTSEGSGGELRVKGDIFDRYSSDLEQLILRANGKPIYVERIINGQIMDEVYVPQVDPTGKTIYVKNALIERADKALKSSTVKKSQADKKSIKPENAESLTQRSNIKVDDLNKLLGK